MSYPKLTPYTPSDEEEAHEQSLSEEERERQRQALIDLL